MMDALLVEPELQNRLMFKQVAREVGLYRSVTFATTLREGMERLNGKQDWHVLYIATRFDIEVIREFIPVAKGSARGKDAAYILVVRGEDNSAEMVARGVACGADGFLVEPYSVDALSECTRLAAKVRRQRVDARLKQAVSMLAESAVARIDEAWADKKRHNSTTAAFSRLQELQDDVRSLPPEYLQVYFDHLIEKTSNAKVPPSPGQAGKYGGISNRVKARMIKKGG